MNYFRRAYALGVKEAESAFKPVAPPKPSAPTKNVLPDNPVGMKPMKPAATPQIDIAAPQTPLSMPAQQPMPFQIGQNSMQHSALNALNSQMKMIDPLAKFSVEGYAVETDNGPYHKNKPQTNESGEIHRSVSQGFENLRVQKNTDFINDGNEGAFTSPQGGMDL